MAVSVFLKGGIWPPFGNIGRPSGKEGEAIFASGNAGGVRTRSTAVKGRCLNQLDHGVISWFPSFRFPKCTLKDYSNVRNSGTTPAAAWCSFGAGPLSLWRPADPWTMPGPVFVAEKVGFEPTLLSFSTTPLAGEPLQPSLGTSPCGRGDRVRTCGPMLPKHVRYQTALHPDMAAPVGLEPTTS